MYPVECTGGRTKKPKWIKPFALRGAWVTNFILVHVVPGVAAVFVSVFGYFLYMITAFSAVAALLIGLSGNSAIEKVLHYPRPIVDEAVIATNHEPSNLLNRRQLEEPKRKEETPARDKKDADAISVAKADTAKRKSEPKYRPEKLAHKPKVLAHQRERQERGYSVALGYSEGSGYRPGLDAQR